MAEFNEADHPRASDGKFGSGGGEGTKAKKAITDKVKPNGNVNTSDIFSKEAMPEYGSGMDTHFKIPYNAKWKEETVDLADLHPAQKEVSAKGVEEYMEGKGRSQNDLPSVVRDEKGNLIAKDGHHRLAAMMAKGETKVKVKTVTVEDREEKFDKQLGENITKYHFKADSNMPSDLDMPAPVLETEGTVSVNKAEDKDCEPAPTDTEVEACVTKSDDAVSDGKKLAGALQRNYERMDKSIVEENDAKTALESARHNYLKAQIAANQAQQKREAAEAEKVAELKAEEEEQARLQKEQEDAVKAEQDAAKKEQQAAEKEEQKKIEDERKHEIKIEQMKAKSSETIEKLKEVSAKEIEKIKLAAAKKKSDSGDSARADDQTEHKQAAGVLFISDGGKVLLGMRAEPGDYHGHWGIFGGHHEEGEDLRMTAIREVAEETGHIVAVQTDETSDSAVAPLQSIATTHVNGTDFTYFVNLCEEFPVLLNEEHTSYGWFSMGEELPFGPMIPGLEEVLNSEQVVELRKKRMTETDIAKAMVRGALPSPQFYANMALFKMRVTGTGTSFRRGSEAVKDKDGKIVQAAVKDEFVYRRPENYLSQEFMDRCAGLAVIFEHPKKKILDSEEYKDRNIGSVMMAYLQGDEVWGVAKIYDEDSITLLSNEKMSTSPSVVFQDRSVNSTIDLDDGSTLLIEGKPSLLDHLAVCEKGVWDKGGEASGIESELVIADSVNSTGVKEMNEDEMKAKADAEAEQAKADAAKADAEEAPPWAKKFADSLNARMDSIENVVMADRAKADAAKADGAACTEPAEVAADKKADAEAMPGDDEKAKADAAKADAEAAEEKEKEEAMKADAARADAAIKALEADNKSMKEMLARVSAAQNVSDEDRAVLADIQARADEVANAFGARAPAALAGETAIAYRKRLASKYKAHSSQWKDVDVTALPDQVLAIAEDRIYADALNEASHPADIAPGTLREVTKVDHRTGRRMTEFVGSMSAWMDDFKAPAQQQVRISNGKE